MRQQGEKVEQLVKEGEALLVLSETLVKIAITIIIIIIIIIIVIVIIIIIIITITIITIILPVKEMRMVKSA